MDCHCLAQSRLPHTTQLFSTYLEEFPKLGEFYAHPPTDVGAIAAAAEIRLDAEVRGKVVGVLREQNERFGGDGATMGNLERLAAGAAAVVTGQQVGLFGGPAYSVYKALTALNVAERLTQQGTDSVAIFWLATEDHDLAEVNHCYWAGQHGLARLELSGEGVGPRSVGQIALGEGIFEIIRTASDGMEGPAAQEIRGWLEDSYRPQDTFGSAFGKLFARMLPGRGIILLDPLDRRLQRLAVPLYEKVLGEHENLTRELLARGKELERAGYHAQVRVTERSTLLFLRGDEGRLPLRRQTSGFAAGKRSYSLRQLEDEISEDPQGFSANVLLRPVLQDSLLPTAAYVGGPAEIAYFAQAEVVYRRLLGRMPAVLPRASLTLVPPKIARLLKKYGLGIEDVFRGKQILRTKMEAEFLPRGLAKRFDAGEKSIRRVLEGLREPIGKLDKTLVGALGTAEQKILYQLLHLRDKAGRAENMRSGVLDEHERDIVALLYPHHGLQERSLNFLPFLAAQGLQLLNRLAQETGSDPSKHRVLFL